VKITDLSAKYTVWFMPIGFECKNTNK